MKKEILEQLKIIFEIMADDQFTDSVANFCWNMFMKLKLKGFTEDQAMKIVAGMAKSQGK